MAQLDNTMRHEVRWFWLPFTIEGIDYGTPSDVTQLLSYLLLLGSLIAFFWRLLMRRGNTGGDQSFSMAERLLGS